MKDEPKGIQEMLRDYVSLAHRCMGWGASEEDRRACRDSYEALDSRIAAMQAVVDAARVSHGANSGDEGYSLYRRCKLCVVIDHLDSLKSSVVPVESSEEKK